MKILQSREGKAPLERGQEMARRSPAVTGNEVRVSQTRIQVEPRTKNFVRPEPFWAQGIFYASVRVIALSQTISTKRSLEHEKHGKDHGKDRKPL